MDISVLDEIPLVLFRTGDLLMRLLKNCWIHLRKKKQRGKGHQMRGVLHVDSGLTFTIQTPCHGYSSFPCGIFLRSSIPS